MLIVNNLESWYIIVTIDFIISTECLLSLSIPAVLENNVLLSLLYFGKIIYYVKTANTIKINLVKTICKTYSVLRRRSINLVKFT